MQYWHSLCDKKWLIGHSFGFKVQYIASHIKFMHKKNGMKSLINLSASNNQND